MIKTLTKNGSGMYLMIPKAIREVLRIKDDTPLDISTDGDLLVVKPIRDKNTQNELEAKKAQFRKIQDELYRDHGDVFKRLAE